MKTEHKYTNSLITESSPYLLQHAHNPVNWHAWNDESLALAHKENKLILVSIGYSACHWCHVMEHESFEDEQVAKIMNENFICIKVDREERPDIDQVYMAAVQLMTGRGGWPLNCFALPDGRPVYGGTYFPKQNWIEILLNLTDLFEHEPQKVIEYAKKLTEGVKELDVIRVNPSGNETLTKDILKEAVDNWKKQFDPIEGGMARAPKFPMSNNYQFLLRYYHASKDESVLNHVKLTLDKMAFGGIYDQLGGGFARYSTDMLWKVPHFEKMLYDNAQLVTLYCEAFQVTNNALYKQVVYETLEFVEMEMTSPEGAFYSALDADSEGKEGEFYIWKKEELENVFKDKFNLFADYYNVNETGFWEEEEKYILLRKKSNSEIASSYKITIEKLEEEISKMKNQLLEIRSKRVKPGLDDKTLTSWNALMLKGYVDAYNVFNDKKFLKIAIGNAEFILKRQRKDDGGLWHNYKNGKSTINGYLEDYAFTIEAFISLYQSTFDTSWLNHAKALMDYTIKHFYDAKSGMFYFTSDLDKALIARKMEISDNVIPASNSSIAKSLFYLARFYDEVNYAAKADTMVRNVVNEIKAYPGGYSNWAMLLLHMIYPFKEIAIVGKDVDEKMEELKKHYNPNVIFAGSKIGGDLALLKDRYVDNKTLIYVCEDKTCQLPVTEVNEALQLLNV